jgi:hypothetical protein
MKMQQPISNGERRTLDEADPQGFDDPSLEAMDDRVPAGHEAAVCGPVMDEEDARRDDYARGYQDAARVGLRHIQEVLRCMDSFTGNGHFAIHCAMAAHGLWAALRERDQLKVANFFQCERANVNKLVKMMQKGLKLPPSLGQRSTEGCENMSEQRKSQLSPLKTLKTDSATDETRIKHGWGGGVSREGREG